MPKPSKIPNIIVKTLLLLFFSPIIFYFAYSFLYAFGFFVWPVSGNVLDEETNKPVSDATIVVNWKGSAFAGLVDARTACVHGEITQTDNQGQYKTPFSWRVSQLGLIEGRRDSISVYKSGYEVSEKTYDFSSQDRNEYYLKPIEGTRYDRLMYLHLFPMACGKSEELARKNSVLMGLFFKEAKMLMQSGEEPTSNEWSAYHSLKWHIATVSVGPGHKLPMQSHNENIESFIREHLQ